jgi:uncharacterized protein with PQ loop repeat
MINIKFAIASHASKTCQYENTKRKHSIKMLKFSSINNAFKETSFQNMLIIEYRIHQQNKGNPIVAFDGIQILLSFTVFH